MEPAVSPPVRRSAIKWMILLFTWIIGGVVFCLYVFGLLVLLNSIL